VARYYKKHTGLLVPLGLTIFVLAFVLIAATAGPYLLRTVTMQNISLESVDMGSARIDMQASEDLMQRRCSRCHTLDRVIGARKDARGWLDTINRMRALPASAISESDAKIILSYLLAENSIDSSSARGELAVGKALVDSHCGRCHALDRTYKSIKTANEWTSTVARMARYARDFKPGEEQRIVQFLSATQTGAAQAPSPLSPDRAGSGAQAKAKFASQEQSPSGMLSMGVAVVIFGSFGLLLLRPVQSSSQKRPATASGDQGAPVPVARAGNTAAILQLVRVERQTRDCVSLRFRTPEGQSLGARPGQFLTFDFLLDGQKLKRSFSISSSPSHGAFVEITVKQHAAGQVSKFLNQGAAVGLTVEARGPFGRFVFDERVHQKVVLLAGGSGITPMISMLRYMDDLSLRTEVTLLYSVKTREDIIFAAELDLLATRLPNLRCVVVLTEPDEQWQGAKGRMSREMIVQHVPNLADRTFFLCGPQAFMEHVANSLRDSGVPSDSIVEEKFAAPKATIAMGLDGEGSPAMIEFAKSSRLAESLPGQSLLEVAEGIGLKLPYGCRHGLCGTCATRVLEGDVDSPGGSTLAAPGYALLCVSHARGDVRLDA